MQPLRWGGGEEAHLLAVVAGDAQLAALRGPVLPAGRGYGHGRTSQRLKGTLSTYCKVSSYGTSMDNRHFWNLRLRKL